MPLGCGSLGSLRCGSLGSQLPLGYESLGTQLPIMCGSLVGSQLPLGCGSLGSQLQLGCGSLGSQLPLGCGSLGSQLPLGCGSSGSLLPLGYESLGPIMCGSLGSLLPLGCGNLGSLLPLGCGSLGNPSFLGFASQMALQVWELDTKTVGISGVDDEILNVSKNNLQVDHYERIHFEQRLVNVRPFHVCDTSKESAIQCIDEGGKSLRIYQFTLWHAGVEISVRVVSCDCEPLLVTLVRAHLWPASLSYPRYAFSFKPLDWAESLLLECQVDFCQALYFSCPYAVGNYVCIFTARIAFPCRDEISIPVLLMLLRNTGRQATVTLSSILRFFRHESRQLSFLSERLDAGNVCPACPKVSSFLIINFAIIH